MTVRYANKFGPLLPTALALLLCAYAYAERSGEREAERAFLLVCRRLNQKQYTAAQADIERAVALAPNNAYYLANRGLLLVRLNRRGFDPAMFLGNKYAFGQGELEELGAAARYYQQSLKLNPLDDGHYHSLGWLYALLQEREQALRCFQQAVAIDGSVAMYHISLGLLREQAGESEEAYREYEAAVRLSPEVVDSQFYRDLAGRSPGAAERVVRQNIVQLEDQLRNTPSPILKGRLGKLYLHANLTDRASAVLKEAVTELPSLSRPWHNLGVIYELKGDEAGMKECYLKATYLDRKDASAWEKLGRFHDLRNERAAALGAYASAVSGWMNMTSTHAGRASRVYQARSVVLDDVVPNGFLAYCRPTVNVSEICLRLARFYGEAGDVRMSTYYEELSVKLSP